MSDSDIEKYALSRGYSATDVVKLRERINQIKSPQIKPGAKQEAQNEGRILPNKEKNIEEEKPKNNNKDENESLKNRVEKKKEFVFGSNLFNEKNLTFEPNLRLPTPKNYILGTDDELSVDVFGNSQMNYKLKISPDGTVKMENLAPIFINGLTIDQASDRIINRLKTIYYGLNTQGGGVYAQVTLGQIRSIKVTVIGEVMRPGTYTVPSLATIFNVLYQAGGPSETGSYRNISLIRDNKIIRTLDLYDFLLKADQKDNILVRDQDVIRINDFEKRVHLNGEIKRPAIYEVNKGESLKNVLTFAGNFTERAYKKSIKLIRNTDKELKVMEIAKESFPEFMLEAGDKFLVDSILSTFENRVKIAGAVYRPGDFAIGDNGLKTVKDLIAAAQGLRNDALKTRAILIRKGPNLEPEVISIDLEKLLKNEVNDINLIKEDSLSVSLVSALHEKYEVSIFGEVNKPNRYLYRANMSISDLIIEAGGFKEGAYLSKIELSRRIKKDTLGIDKWQTVKIFESTVDENLKLISDDSKYILQPFDVVTIKTSPQYEIQQTIHIKGEVVYPGEFVIKDREERLSAIIQRAGGFRPSAFVKGAKVARNKQLVSVNFQNAIDNPESLDNILLIKGDTISIPRKSETINIEGAVYNPAIVTYDNQANVLEYVSKAGGFEENALKKNIYVTYANGESKMTKKFLFFKTYPKVEPGATIVVPMQNPENKQKLSAGEKATITTAFVSVSGVLLTIIRILAGK